MKRAIEAAIVAVMLAVSAPALAYLYGFYFEVTATVDGAATGFGMIRSAMVALDDVPEDVECGRAWVKNNGGDSEDASQDFIECRFEINGERWGSWMMLPPGQTSQDMSRRDSEQLGIGPVTEIECRATCDVCGGNDVMVTAGCSPE